MTEALPLQSDPTKTKYIYCYPSNDCGEASSRVFNDEWVPTSAAERHSDREANMLYRNSARNAV